MLLLFAVTILALFVTIVTMNVTLLPSVTNALKQEDRN